MTKQRLTDPCQGCPLRRANDCILSNDEVVRLDGQRIELSYKRGENICKQGAFTSSITCIRSGLVKVYKEDHHASSTLVLRKQGDIIGLQSLYGEGVCHCSVEALTDTKVCLIDLAIIKELLHENSDIAAEVIKHINQDMDDAFDRLFSFSTKHVHGRLAELLLYLKTNIYGSNPFNLTLTKTDLAEILGTSKESISRLFKELKSDGIIEESEHIIRILDEPRLKRISHTG